MVLQGESLEAPSQHWLASALRRGLGYARGLQASEPALSDLPSCIELSAPLRWHPSRDLQWARVHAQVGLTQCRLSAQPFLCGRRASPRVPPASRMSTLVAKAVAVGDKLPSATFKYFDSEGNMKEISTEGLCKGKKVQLTRATACQSS